MDSIFYYRKDIYCTPTITIQDEYDHDSCSMFLISLWSCMEVGKAYVMSVTQSRPRRWNVERQPLLSLFHESYSVSLLWGRDVCLQFSDSSASMESTRLTAVAGRSSTYATSAILFDFQATTALFLEQFSKVLR